ncbi:MAG: GNAT family N-acetyltransferase [Hyphomicrobiales bacterium]|nr:GNAT family N-acetyltransferase [Hyphomicrobiales bacterium]
MSKVFFVSGRLAFRQFELGDVPALSQIVSDPSVMCFVGDGVPLSTEQALLWIERSRANVKRFGYGTGAVVENATKTLIGWAGFARPEGRPEEIVYGLGAPHWGKGYGAELLDHLLGFGLDVVGLTQLRASVDPRNDRSISLLQKRGFRLVDTQYDGDPYSHQYLFCAASP